MLRSDHRIERQRKESSVGVMDPIIRTGIAITFLGLLCLMIGYTNRDRNFGPLLIWGGVMSMVGVIVYYILMTLK